MPIRAAVYGEDCVGYFLSPNAAPNTGYQIYFSTIGTIFDQKILVDAGGKYDYDRSWNADCEVRAAKGPGYWSLEAKIPLKQFGITAAPGQQWGLNFRRKQFRLNEAADWQVPLDPRPKTYGVLILK